IDTALYNGFGQRLISTIFTQSNQYRVVLEVKPEFRQGPDALKDIYVASSSGAQVPLSAITTVTEKPALLAVNHLGQFPAATISFNLAPGASLGAAVSAIEAQARALELPLSVRTSFQGAALAFRASLANELLLILAAIVTMYIVLGVLYESYIHPLTILSTLPSAGVGALLALMLTRSDLGIIAVIGIILLIGIVKKNAIMMIDFALDAERKDGMGPRDAIYHACLLRFRPILMPTRYSLLGRPPRAPAGGLSDDLGERAAARREPRGDGGDRGDAARARARPHRRRHRDHFVLVARQLARHAAVRPRPRHRRRRARRAGCDQRRAQPVAHQPAAQSHLPQGQSGRRADHDPRAHLRHAGPRRDVRRRFHHPRAENFPGRRRRPGDGGRRLAPRGARGAESDGAQQVRDRAGRSTHGALRSQRQPPQGLGRGGRSPLADHGRRPGDAREPVHPAERPPPERRGGTPNRRLRGTPIGGGRAQRRHRQRQALGARHHQPAAERQHHRYDRARPR